jgi:hypothetical protein
MAWLLLIAAGGVTVAAVVAVVVWLAVRAGSEGARDEVDEPQ